MFGRRGLPPIAFSLRVVATNGFGPLFEGAADLDLTGRRWTAASAPDSSRTFRTRSCGRVHHRVRPSRFGAETYSKFHVFSTEWTPEKYAFRSWPAQLGLQLQRLEDDDRPRQCMGVGWMRGPALRPV